MEQTPTIQQRVDEVIGRLGSLDDMRHICPSRKGEGEPLLSNESVRRIVELSRQLMFPGFYDESAESYSVLRSIMTIDCRELLTLLHQQITAGLCFDSEYCESDVATLSRDAKETAVKFIEALPSIRHLLDADIDATYLGDPAAVSTHEVIACYSAAKRTHSSTHDHGASPFGNGNRYPSGSHHR